MIDYDDDTCPECLGDGINPLDPSMACPLCGGEGRMSFARALANLADSAEEDERRELRPSEQN